MKKLLNSAVTVSVLALSFVSCEKPDSGQEVLPASVSIGLEATTANSIAFTLNPENAVSMAYSVVEKDSGIQPEYIPVESSDTTRIEARDLLPETTYMIYAYAVNMEDVACEPVSIEARTTENAQISIEVIESTVNSVTFNISPVNATSYAYACSTPDMAQMCELTVTVDNGDHAENLTIGNLEPNTNYTLVAQAYNAGVPSKRVYAPFKTQVAPVIEITEIVPDDVDARIDFTATDVAELYYAVIPAGDQVGNDDYESLDLRENDLNSIYIYGLEPATDYTVHIYGISTSDFKGEEVEAGFTTLEAYEKDLRVELSDITALDATVTVTFDKEKYSRVRWTAGTQESIPDPYSFDWEAAISAYQVKTISGYNNGSPVSLAGNFGNIVKSGVVLRLGFVPCALENQDSLIMSDVIWREVKLSELEFGSDASVSITQNRLSHRRINYTVSTDNATSYFMAMGTTENIETQTLDWFVEKKVLASTPSTVFDTDIASSETLLSATSYTIVAVPVDAQGMLGQIVTYEFTTKAMDNTDGKGVVSAEFMETGYTYAMFDISVDSETERLYVAKRAKGQMTDEVMISNLVRGSAYLTESDDTYYFTNMQCNSENEVWFCAEDKDGNLSEILKVDVSIPALDYTGTAQVDADISYDASSMQLTVNFTPDENVGRYWFATLGQYALDWNDPDAIASRLLQTQESNDMSYYYEPRDGACEEVMDWVQSSDKLVVLVEDKDGNLSPVSVYPVS